MVAIVTQGSNNTEEIKLHNHSLRPLKKLMSSVQLFLEIWLVEVSSSLGLRCYGAAVFLATRMSMYCTIVSHSNSIL